MSRVVCEVCRDPVEIMSPAEYEYDKSGGITIRFKCRCLSGHDVNLIIREAGGEVITAVSSYAQSGLYAPVPVKDWPKLIEHQAVTWALDMEK